MFDAQLSTAHECRAEAAGAAGNQNGSSFKHVCSVSLLLRSDARHRTEAIVAGVELVIRALAHETATIEHKDTIALADGTQTVSDQDDRDLAAQVVHGIHDRLFR